MITDYEPDLVSRPMRESADACHNISDIDRSIPGEYYDSDVEFADIEHGDMQRYLNLTNEILNSSKFDRAANLFVAEMVRIYSPDLHPSGSENSISRNSICFFIVHNYLSHKIGKSFVVPSISLLKHKIDRLSVCSNRQADHVISRLIDGKYIDVLSHGMDARIKILRPTAKLLAWDASLVSSYYRTLEIIYDQAAYPKFSDDLPSIYYQARSGKIANNTVLELSLSIDPGLSDIFRMKNFLNFIMRVYLNNKLQNAPEYDMSAPKDICNKLGFSTSHLRNICESANILHLIEGYSRECWPPRLTNTGVNLVESMIARILAYHKIVSDRN